MAIIMSWRVGRFRPCRIWSTRNYNVMLHLFVMTQPQIFSVTSHVFAYFCVMISSIKFIFSQMKIINVLALSNLALSGNLAEYLSFSRLSATDQWSLMECSIWKVRRLKSLRPNSTHVIWSVWKDIRKPPYAAVKIYQNSTESIVQM